jgi:hypothetical protein
MRGRLVRGLVAAVLAVVVVLPGHAQPAHAVSLETIGKVIDIATRAVTLVKSILGGGVSDAALKEAVRQIIVAVEAAKTEIIAHIDAIAAAEVRACVRHHVIEFADVDRFTQDVLQRWAQDATGCATLADSVLRAVSDKAAADNVGLGLNVIGPIALAARARAGFSTSGLMATLRSGNEAIIPKLAPDCWETRVKEPATPIVEIWYECRAYNGDYASDSQIIRRNKPIGPPIDKARVAAEATKRTSRAVAVAVLPQLTS